MRKFWPFSFYFFYFAAIAVLLPYLVLYYGELGMDGRQIGVLSSLAPLVTLFSAPLWTGYADATHRHRLVLSFSLFFSVASILAVSVVNSFWTMLPLIVLFAFAIAPANPLADSATMDMLGNEQEKYGRVRLGGSIGYMIASLAAGIIIQQTGLHASFYMFTVLMLISLLIGLKLIFSRVQAKVSVTKGIWTLLSNTRWVLFLAMVFIGGVGLTVVNTYLFLYMNELGASKTVMGISMVVSSLSEVPILFFSNFLIQRFRAHGLLLLGLAVTGLRLVLFSLVNLPLGIVVLQSIQGLTFPIIWVAGVAYANEHSPRGMSATAQGLFGSMLMGFGAAAGNLIGGFLMDAYGMQIMYMFFGLLVLGALLVFHLIELRLPEEVEYA
jgi:MFS transporter, PPP family, 3-phenylpropionic acid transporter